MRLVSLYQDHYRLRNLKKKTFVKLGNRNQQESINILSGTHGSWYSRDSNGFLPKQAYLAMFVPQVKCSAMIPPGHLSQHCGSLSNG